MGVEAGQTSSLHCAHTQPRHRSCFAASPQHLYMAAVLTLQDPGTPAQPLWDPATLATPLPDQRNLARPSLVSRTSAVPPPALTPAVHSRSAPGQPPHPNSTLAGPAHPSSTFCHTDPRDWLSVLLDPQQREALAFMAPHQPRATDPHRPCSSQEPPTAPPHLHPSCH